MFKVAFLTGQSRGDLFPLPSPAPSSSHGCEEGAAGAVAGELCAGGHCRFMAAHFCALAEGFACPGSIPLSRMEKKSFSLPQALQQVPPCVTDGAFSPSFLPWSDQPRD